ncbi:hypothetical protein FOFC_16582 [Fusarium oxysporum]|nr:hypothetical protein FOFC_16582 [Fusarium oxysporum]
MTRLARERYPSLEVEREIAIYAKNLPLSWARINDLRYSCILDRGYMRVRSHWKNINISICFSLRKVLHGKDTTATTVARFPAVLRIRTKRGSSLVAFLRGFSLGVVVCFVRHLQPVRLLAVVHLKRLLMLVLLTSFQARMNFQTSI